MNQSKNAGMEDRCYPMQKKPGFTPAVQRYSAEFPDDISAFRVCYLGVQGRTLSASDSRQFLDIASTLFNQPDGPLLFDFAQYTDPQSYDTIFATAYWSDKNSYKKWLNNSVYREWWNDIKKDKGDLGYFRESIEVSTSSLETIAFKEYIRGLAACPRHKIKPMGESGYWGAARDRIPASGFNKLESSLIDAVPQPNTRPSIGKRLRIRLPQNIVVIRSGVSWRDCGEEQLTSYEKNLKPKLDLGMEFLRQNPVESGCLNMRQVDVIDSEGKLEKESFCLGYFASLQHLESWSRNHPSHLAIFGQAQKERQKYKDRLELRTYHEIFVVDRDADLDYVNCHHLTGLIPYFAPQ